MDLYWFVLRVGPVHDLDGAADRLYAICGDAQLAGDERGGSVEFSRKSDSRNAAVLTAIMDAEAAGLKVLGVAGGC